MFCAVPEVTPALQGMLVFALKVIVMVKLWLSEGWSLLNSAYLLVGMISTVGYSGSVP